MSETICIAAEKVLLNTSMKSWSLSNIVRKKQQMLIQKAYQFIHVVSRSHKTAKIFVHSTQLHSLLTGMYIYRSTRRHYKGIHLIIIPIANSLVTYQGHGTHSTVETRWLSG